MPPDFSSTPFYRPPGPETDFIIGLDLAQVQDFSALVVCSRTSDPEGDRPCRYDVVSLKRWERGTRYTAIVEDLAALLRGPKVPGGQLVADVTGVGRGVWEMIVGAGIDVVPITITAGRGWSWQQSEYRVSKIALVATLQALLSARRLRVARGAELSEQLIAELLNFRCRITPHGNETFSAWRESDRDDCVLALAVALWHAERAGVPYRGPALPILLTPGLGQERPPDDWFSL